MHAIKYFNRLLLAMLLVVATTACERRPLVLLNEGNVTVNLNVDWSKFDAPAPEKMTLFFFPVDGGAPIVRTYQDDVTKASVTLPAGKYTVVAMNEDIPYFDCYEISQTPELNVVLKDGKDPLPLGLDRITIEVPETEIYVDADGNLAQEAVIVASETLYPQDILWKGNVTVNVGGFNKVKEISGALSGLAASFLKSPASVTQNLTDWTAQPNELNFRTEDFRCLGVPENFSGKPEDSILTLEFLLDDGTKVVREVPVGDTMKVDEEKRTVSVTIYTKVVEPVSGGFDIVVDPWDEEK